VLQKSLFLRFLMHSPFSETAEQAMKAAIQFRVHYFDITAEVDIYRLAEGKGSAAKGAGMLGVHLNVGQTSYVNHLIS